MVIDPAVTWSELAAIIYGLVLEGRETESGRGPTDLFALADSLAESIGGAGIIEDRRSPGRGGLKMHPHAPPARGGAPPPRPTPQRARGIFESRGGGTQT